MENTAQVVAVANPFQQVRVSLVQKDSLRALANCKVCDAVFLQGLRVVEGSKGIFVSMPSRKTVKGDYQDIYFPASREMRNLLQETVLKEYELELAKQ
jgi:stage V sporulation protein G